MYKYERLRNLREERKMTQPQIANLLKITRQQYSLYEIGRREIPVHHLRILAMFYGVSSDYILEIADTNETKEGEKM